MKNDPDHAALIERATAAYIRRARSLGNTERKPSASISRVKGSDVILRDANGELAHYRLDRSGKLRFVDSTGGSVDS